MMIPPFLKYILMVLMYTDALKILTFVRLAVVICLAAQATGCIGKVMPDDKEEVQTATPEMDAKLISISVNGNAYTLTGQPVQLITDQVFSFVVAMQNTGTATWGQDLSQGERGSSFLSRDPDLNTIFGIFFISPGQGQHTAPSETFVFNSSLRAPSMPGDYTMKWLLADWIIPYGNNYSTKPLYGDTVIVKVTVTARTEQPPPKPPRKQGVLDVADFEYIGSFSLPPVPDVPQDEKAFFKSGITLRTIGGEKRMLLTTGTYDQHLYEVAIPALGKFIGNDYSAVPMAELRTRFGRLPKDAEADNNGTMWYDETVGLLYWTNFHSYYFENPPLFPVLRSAKLDGGVLTEVRLWLFPSGVTTHYKSFWGGVTTIPEGFAALYTGGRRMALGFGGAYSIVQSASNGPTIAAISPDFQSGAINFQNIMYYPYPETCIRDGNYFSAGAESNVYLNPTAPWAGTWSDKDQIGSGLFIDLPDKKGYVAFTRQATGRIGYDYGGSNWNGAYQNVWYFYDFEMLGKAATDIIPKNDITPTSMSIVEFPYDLTKDKQFVAGSCFDPETRRVYLYTMEAFKTYSMYNDPVVHVYSVKSDP